MSKFVKDKFGNCKTRSTIGAPARLLSYEKESFLWQYEQLISQEDKYLNKLNSIF